MQNNYIHVLYSYSLSEKDFLQILKVIANMLNMQLHATEEVWSSTVVSDGDKTSKIKCNSML
jgi:hypothetical protein